MPKFSIIVPHYQGAVNHSRFCRGIQSLFDQSYRDYEILCYHDGPLLDGRLPMPLEVRCTDRRHDDYGHSLRDLGIREASGDYVILFNPDNVLYDNALEEIDRVSRRRAMVFDESGTCLDASDLIVFPVLMRGVQVAPGRICRFDDLPDLYTIFTGVPVKLHNIDAMQLVMRKTLWIDEGGWYDKSHDGDGIMYEKFAAKYGYRTVGPVLGEHW